VTNIIYTTVRIVNACDVDTWVWQLLKFTLSYKSSMNCTL